MLVHALLRRLAVIGDDREQRVGAGIHRELRQLDRMMCVVAAGSRHDIVVRDRGLDHAHELDLLRVRQGRRLAGGAGDDHSVGAVVDEHRRELFGGGVID